MLINYNNTEVGTRTVMELKLSVAIFISFGLFLQCFHVSHIRHWWDKIFVSMLHLHLL